MRLPSVPPARLLIAIVILAGILNVFHIDHTSLWNDEAFSFFAANAGLAHTIDFIADDTQPPLYYLTLSLWLHLGTSVFAIRALSATAMTLALFPLHAAARRLFNERTALLATLLFAIAPLDLTWAQKARPYPLQVLLVACAFWGFIRIWHAGGNQIIGAGIRQAIRQRAIRPAGIDLGWFAYAAGGACAMLTQDPAGFFLLGCNVAMAISIFSNLGRNRMRLLNWIIAQLILISIWMLWLPTFLHQVATHLTSAQIASKHAIFLVTFDQVLGTMKGLFGIASLWRLGPVFLPIILGIACFATVMIILRKRPAWPLLAVIVVPIAASIAGFFLIHPVFGYVIYTFAWILVPWSILLAFGVLSLRPAILRWAVLALVLLGNLWGVKNVLQNDTPPLDKVAAAIAENREPGDGIILSEKASGRWGLAYYLGPPYGAMPGLSIQDWGDGAMIKTATEAERLPRVWVVLIDGEPPAVDLDALRRCMNAAMVQSIVSRTSDTFHITRFDGCGPTACCH